MQSLGVWIAAFLTLSIYSFLYKENPFSVFAEHLFLGIATGHAMVVGYQNVVNMAWNPLTQKGETLWIFPLIGGLLLLMRLVPSVAWVSRAPLGFMMGVAAGLSLKRAIDSEFWRQMRSTAAYSLTTFDNIFYVATVIAVLAYFFFGVSDKSKHGALIAKVGKFGQYVMMIAFGASLGATIMARLSLVIARLQFLFGVWLPILPKR